MSASRTISREPVGPRSDGTGVQLGGNLLIQRALVCLSELTILFLLNIILILQPTIAVHTMPGGFRAAVHHLGVGYP